MTHRSVRIVPGRRGPNGAFLAIVAGALLWYLIIEAAEWLLLP